MAYISAAKLVNQGNSLSRVNTFLDPTQSFTICFWNNRGTNVLSGGNFRQYYYFGAAGAGPYIYVGSGTDTDDVLLEYFDGTNYNDAPLFTQAANTWKFFHLTYDQVTHVLNLYVDTVLKATLTFNLSLASWISKNDLIGGGSPDFKFSNYRQWQAKLSIPEIIREREEYLSVRQANLLADNPISTIFGSTAVYLRDNSGNGRSFIVDAVAPTKIQPGPFTEIGPFQVDESLSGFSPVTEPGPTLVKLTGQKDGLHLYSPIDSGTIPSTKVVILWEAELWSITSVEDPGSGRPTLGAGQPVRNFFGTVRIGQGGSGGSTDQNGVTSWVDDSTITVSSSDRYLGINQASGPDYINPITLCQWRRDNVFSLQAGFRAIFYNSNSLFTFHSRDILFSAPFAFRIYYLQLTSAPLPPSTPFGGIYYIKPNKTNDTVYYGVTGGYSNYHPYVTTQIVPIPNPYFIQ